MSGETWFVDGVELSKMAWCIREIPDGAVPKRGEDLTVARRDGLVHRRKFFDVRVLPITMGIRSQDEFGRKSPDVYRFNVDRLKETFHSVGLLEVRRVALLPENRLLNRTLHAETLTSFAVETPSGFSAGTFTVELSAADPFWYELPKTLKNKSGAFQLFNPGTVQSRKVVVTIEGPATDPTLTVDKTGTSVTWQGTLSSSESVTIDSDAFTVVDQDGVSVAGQIVRAQPSLVEVAPGYNRLELSSGTCDVTWKAAYL